LTTKIKVSKAKKSKIKDVDFENFSFGSVFTDHMFECEYVNGKWENPVIRPYEKISIEPSASVFHYGQAIFEGMKAFKDDNDNVFLFRPNENFERINKSAIRMSIPQIERNLFFSAIEQLVNLDKDWIKKGEGKSLYIRPFIIATDYAIQAVASNNYKFMIICAPATLYYTKKLSVLIADKYSRAASGGFGYAKAAGNYAGQFYPTNLAKKSGFDQVIWTDSNEHKYIEEAGTMNIFFRIDNELYTAPITDTILDGVTRKSIIEIAKNNGIAVNIKKISVQEIISASNEKRLKEIFGTGTAAIVSQVSGFKYKDEYFEVKEQNDSYAELLKTKLLNIQTNQSKDPLGWRYKI
jgi:branched-chain amino acid aminotransferase